jgi:hypothetical protein
VKVRASILGVVVAVAVAACGGTSIEDAVSEHWEGVDVTCERVAAKVLGEEVYSCALADIEDASGGPAVLGCYVYTGDDLREVSDELGSAVAGPGREGIGCG